jgi:hypothetical protein
MPRPTKSLDPSDRMGIYKTLSEVPARYRLHHHADAYAGRDVWQEFCEEYEYAKGDHERYKEEVNRAGDCWREFMDDRGRHHALTTPDYAEGWLVDLRREGSTSLRRLHDYWLRVNRFYNWLKWHTEHPHVYNPLLMAAADGGLTGEVWEWKAEQTREARERHRRGD